MMYESCCLKMTVAFFMYSVYNKSKYFYNCSVPSQDSRLLNSYKFYKTGKREEEREWKKELYR